MPAFLFPKNRQATGMNRTLCQGAPKPPQSAAPSLMTDLVWAKVGPGQCQVFSGPPGSQEWNPTGTLAEGPHSPPRAVQPCFCNLSGGQRTRDAGTGRSCSIAPCPLSLRPLKKCPLSQRRPLHLSPVSLVSGGRPEREHREGVEAQGRAYVRLFVQATGGRGSGDQPCSRARP